MKGQSTDEAMDWLLEEIDKGIRSGKEEGWLTEEEMDRRFERRREKVLVARKARMIQDPSMDSGAHGVSIKTVH